MEDFNVAMTKLRDDSEGGHVSATKVKAVADTAIRALSKGKNVDGIVVEMERFFIACFENKRDESKLLAAFYALDAVLKKEISKLESNSISRAIEPRLVRMLSGFAKRPEKERNQVAKGLSQWYTKKIYTNDELFYQVATAARIPISSILAPKTSDGSLNENDSVNDTANMNFSSSSGDVPIDAISNPSLIPLPNIPHPAMHDAGNGVILPVPPVYPLPPHQIPLPGSIPPMANMPPVPFQPHWQPPMASVAPPNIPSSQLPPPIPNSSAAALAPPAPTTAGSQPSAHQKGIPVISTDNNDPANRQNQQPPPSSTSSGGSKYQNDGQSKGNDNKGYGSLNNKDRGPSSSQPKTQNKGSANAWGSFSSNKQDNAPSAPSSTASNQNGNAQQASNKSSTSRPGGGWGSVASTSSQSNVTPPEKKQKLT